MGESKGTEGVDVIPLNQPLTWTCPEGHMFRFRRRPLLSSCMFIFCFLIMERAAVYCLRTFLFRRIEKAVATSMQDATTGYVWISLYNGLYDLSPILLAVLSDTYLGNFKAIVVFGFTFVFGLVLVFLLNSSSLLASTAAPLWLNGIGLFIVTICAGGLLPLLTSFGARQFHPQSQTASGSRFFSLVYPMASLGAIIGTIIAVFVYTGTRKFAMVLLSAAILGGLGWLGFIFGTKLYIERCMHSQTARRFFSLVFDCVRKLSVSKNCASNGGKYPNAFVGDFALVFRLVPVFVCLIPLYLGQLQFFTMLRAVASQLATPNFAFSRRMPAEMLQLTEPLTAIAVSFILNEFLYPLLRRRNLMPSHLTRLTAAAFLIVIGFVGCLLVTMAQRSRALTQTELGAEGIPSLSIFVLIGPLVLFAVGQLLITSSGLELSWSYAPDGFKSISVALFSGIYAMGSILSVGLFGALPRVSEAQTSIGYATFARNRLYFVVCICLAGVSFISLICLRRFHAVTRERKIARDVEKRALEIAKARLYSKV
jgi:dipeptide/tripeptide permease